MQTERERMVSGALYRPGDPELVSLRQRAQRLMARYNATVYGDSGREDILRDLLGGLGRDCAVRAPFYVDYGQNITLGDNVFLNYGCVLLDVCPITIGNRVDIAPYVQILTADHPRDAATRDKGLEFGKPITVGDNVWIGAGAMLMPSVTIGADAIIGAGSVVTRDVAPGTTVAGIPARPLVPKPGRA